MRAAYRLGDPPRRRRLIYERIGAESCLTWRARSFSSWIPSASAARKDAEKFGDEGADTLGHIAAACAAGAADRAGRALRPARNPGDEPASASRRAAEASTGAHPQGIERIEKPEAIWAYASEVSKGKDTQSGHWELAGLPVPFAWGYFPNTIPDLSEGADRRADRARRSFPAFSATGTPPAPT